VLSFLLAPLAKLLELNLFSDEFLVLAGPVVDTLTGSAGEFY